MAEDVPLARVCGTGFAAALLVFALSYALSAPFTPEFYGTWVALAGILTVPGLLVVGLAWHHQHPATLARLAQPWRGLAYLAGTIMAMIAGAGILYFGPGHAAGVTPMLINVAILTIVAAFWIIGVWKCWPFSRWIGNPVLVGVAAWAASYLLAILVFQTLFNFSAVKNAPFYRPELDPGGLFAFWPALVYFVTTSAVIVAWEKLLGFWPLREPALSLPPLVEGAAASIVILAVSGLWMWGSRKFLAFDTVDFMLRGPIALLFGIFFVTNLSQSRFFAARPQPGRGLRLLVIAFPLGVAFEELYRLAAPAITGRALRPGPPAYELELWVATALLAVTFPLIVIVTGYFDFWPLKRGGR